MPAAESLSPSSGRRTSTVRRLRWFRRAGLGLFVVWVGLQVVAAWIAAHPTPREEPLAAPIDTCFERVTTSSGDAWWCEGAAPAVVLVHGYGGTRAGLLPLATALRKRTGHAVLLPQLAYTNGESTYSGGVREGESVAAALVLAQARTGTPAVVLGISAGGNAAVRAVATGAPAASVIVDSSFSDSASVFATGASRVGHLPPWAWAGMRIVYPLVSSGGRLDDTDLRRWRFPTLAIQCRADEVVRPEEQRRLIAETGAELWAAPCEEHASAWDAAPEPYVDRVGAILAGLVPSRP